MRRHSLLASLLPLLVAACTGSDNTGASGSTTTTSSSSSSSGGGDDGTRITTDKGPVQGAIMGTTRIFLGIPYAAPPVGDLRWKSPAPHAAWTDTLDATKLGSFCAQPTPLSPAFDTNSSEDCLTLNVWTPTAKTSKGSPAPVMVWVHGGSFLIGSGGMSDYDGQKLSEATGAVVVTINYRLGALGFLSLAALRNEAPSRPSSGMYGFEDQRAALAWTRDNIAAFGGDPSNVTLFGESAGGLSTCLHLVSPESKGLFHRAIIQSGACSSSLTTGLAADAQGDKLTTALGCDGKDPQTTLACLRAKKPEDVVLALPASPINILSGVRWFPMVDGVNVPDDPPKLLAMGGAAKVPTLLGANANEGTLFFAFGNTVIDDASYQAFAETLAPGHGVDIVAHYPSASYASPKDAAAMAVSDSAFVCPARRTARALAQAGVTTYLYHFVHASADALITDLGAFHSSEIPFVFGNSTLLLPHSPSDADLPLSAAMMGYWSRMAESGDPNGAGAFAWPRYDAATDENIVLDLAVSKLSGLKKIDCDFWDTL